MKQFIIYLVLLLSTMTFGQSDNSRISLFNLDNKLAIQGYDPVAYFKLNKPAKGKNEWNYSYKGVTYFFSSKENLELFRKTPQIYEPQFGGWCAYAMGESGEKVEINPETFKIIDGKLYLFYNAFFNNTLKSWNKNEKLLKKKAEINWNKYLSKK